MSCWLVVVQREQRDLYALLRERLQGVAGVEVVLDHRTRDRRTRAVVPNLTRQDGSALANQIELAGLR